jgi:hypothetical protein
LAREKSKKTAVEDLPFETADLRRNLRTYLDFKFPDPVTGQTRKVGGFKWGVYAFFDYDREPIYVGQTNESLRSRIGRHLTNQRTDAVAMSVLDPFEVLEIEVYPLPQFQKTGAKDKGAKAHLDALENAVYEKALAESEFTAVLNEKNPPPSKIGTIALPPSYRAKIVSEEVLKFRAHPDIRIARRALTISRLAQVISERKVQGGLRRVMETQARRLLHLSSSRYQALGGAKSVETKKEEKDGADDES